MSLSAPDAGLAQVKQNLSVESLASFNDDGTPRPAVAAGWEVSNDRRTVTLQLRPNVKYQDGAPVTRSDIVATLRRALPRLMGPAFEDVDSIQPAGVNSVDIRFRRPSGFRLELLEIPIQKPGNALVATGPFKPAGGISNQLVANDYYYLGTPSIRRITIENYPTFRSAWADMLRGRNDMLYEVGTDALDSLQNARNIATVFTFLKRYQYLVVLNTQAPALRAPATRQALNLAIDRNAVVRDAMNGHGAASGGPVARTQWAVAGRDVPMFSFDPRRAAALLAATHTPLRFTCLVMADHERLALVVKRQLEFAGVDVQLDEVTSDQLLARVAKRDFDSFLVDMISGPTLLRLYQVWHSNGGRNVAGYKSEAVDAALDRVRHAVSDDEYRAGTEDFQRAMLSDPPAIFLAWSEGARAVSRRFDVPADPDRKEDVIGTLRLWRPANAEALASRN